MIFLTNSWFTVIFYIQKRGKKQVGRLVVDAKLRGWMVLYGSVGRMGIVELN